MIVTDWWWDGDDIIIITESNEQYRLHKPYPTSIKFEGLDYDSSETVQLEQKFRYPKASYDKQIF